ncbi:EscV/YscV/HrcV family type III secretion system export apparatus protein [Mesorhizobium sp. M1A.F.Ca.IN.020.06.1.1]|uniref:type III secretion system export apparatus subunit SctV n=1 Tax=unclassified Mesorhizobium TaxID=325217 RepID=UPI000FCAC693|nr:MULTISPECIES: type III secretion system export apparatus subunit SctV [unclassified Mesorhizobium]RUV82106.1 EscV/YscV/HrcV family type III secretion system export apparatus protein [Mesorhizobium sp. M1A.F.Ca.IN.020.32.1.1]RUW05707.1 EscV/YscV/HrcV family type III secretion system export apparatus protein [Mesorhizobium sp. M1A.F.Ca.IN.022.05.2.1]RUW20437.1 EscV/YscV/HrcV family type III secretion system export apparatus protein [Mesorhizobium sp. M1A.F.Ca.IN.020.06.1.1]RWF82305.1 MAG: EscV
MKFLNRVLAIATGRNDIILAGLLIAIIFVMIVPLPSVLMDVLQAVNLGISALLLMVAVYIKSPLAFVSFPSVLLLTTVFRLSLGIAATRMILLHTDAGQIIATFGGFVVAGNLVVGAVSFLIITIVQFVVITKGSERVAEVAARFSLDAMPGKQMSIDGDLRAGGIDIQEAGRRRIAVERESQLYAAMDGAMKFVKGDAIAGLISIVVNIIGGIAVGALQKGMDLHKALEIYTILTIGDGLVGQIPALFTSITAGFIVTRVSDKDKGSDLGSEIGAEVTAQPRALIIGSFILLLFSLVPGFPSVIFVILAVLAGGGGWLLQRSRPPSAPSTTSDEPAERSGEGGDAITLTIPLMVDISRDVQAIIRPDWLNKELAAVRQALHLDLGVPFPGINLRVNDNNKDGAYTILVNEIPCGEGWLRAQHLLARELPENLDILGIPYVLDKPFLPQIETAWVDIAHRELLQAANIPFLEPVQILSYHIGHVVRRQADEFIGIQETKILLSQVERSFPELVKEVLRSVPLQTISEILKRLVSEEVSLRNMRTILTALVEWAQKEKDTVLLTEHVRCALKRQICFRHSVGGKLLPAYILAPEVEDTVRNAIRQTSAGSYLALDPGITRQILDKVSEAVGNVDQQPHKPVLLTSIDIRRYLRKIIEVDLYVLPVLSYQELTPDISVQPLARISLS